MLKSELIKLLNDIPGDGVIVTRMAGGRGYERIKGVYRNPVTVREGRVFNGMQNKLEYCGKIEESFDAIVLED